MQLSPASMQGVSGYGLDTVERVNCGCQCNDSRPHHQHGQQPDLRRHLHFHCRLVVLLLVVCCMHTAISCPEGCFCEPHSRNVHCTDKGLTAIPDEVPGDTLELILNQNTFINPDLTRRNLTSLSSLQKLYMSRCGIETIAVDTFSDLTDLVWLDISNNKITFIVDHTFRGLRLKHLFINDNVGIHLSERAFEGMTTQGLYMHNTAMTRLPVNVMAPLNGTLKTLWLYQNHLETLPEEWLHLFNSLGHLRLGKNPFHCNCEIGWLHKFFNKHSSVFSSGDLPTCASPAPVRGKHFSNLTADDFRCDLPTFRNVDAVFEQHMGRLTCQARGDPTPTLYWIQPDGTTEIYSPLSEDSEQNEGVLYMANVKLTDSARYKCVASNPAGNVTFSLNVAWPAPLPPPPPPSVPLPADRPKDEVIGKVKADPEEDGRQLQEEMQAEAEMVEGEGDGEGESSEGGHWDDNKAEKKKQLNEELGTDGGEEGAEGGREARMALNLDLDAHFTLLDVVGAVVGTFALTLLLSLMVAQLYWRRKRRLLGQEDHYSVPDCKPPGPPLVPPARLYITSRHEDPENRVRMLHCHHHHHHPSGHVECPS